MIHTVFHVLGIIGIVLLCLLAAVLLLAGLILFVPVRYSVYAEREEKLNFSLKAYWFLHIFSLCYKSPEEKAVKIKIFGKVVYGPGKKEKTEKSGKHKKGETPEESPGDAPDADPDIGPEESPEKGPEESPECRADETPETEPDGERRKKPKNSKHKRTGKKKNPFQKIIDLFRKLKYTITHFYDTIIKVKNNIGYYLDVLREEQTISVFKNCRDRLFKILKKLKPRRLNADLSFSAGSPDNTGYILGIYGMLIPYLGDHVYLTPDFEADAAFYRGNFFAKGNITVFTLLVNFLIVYKDPDFEPVMKKLKRED